MPKKTSQFFSGAFTKYLNNFRILNGNEISMDYSCPLFAICPARVW